MSMIELVEAATAYVQARDKLAAQAKQTTREQLHEAFRPLFDSGKLKTIAWQQYTPYFNDGDPCCFTVSGPLLFDAVAKFNEDDEEYDGGDSLYFLLREGVFLNEFVRQEKDKLYEKYGTDVVDTVLKLWRCLSVGDLLQQLFGEGSRVTVTAESINVEDYDCGY